MSKEVLGKLVKSGCQLAFQGGEPTLMGVDFYRGIGRPCSLQTNGTLIDEKWAEFLKAEGWLVGLSVDGPEAVHDKHRQCFTEVKRGYECLMRHGVEVNTLTLVSEHNVKNAKEIYRFLRDELGSYHQQYIECTTPKAFAVNGKEWGDFLIELFDTWFTDGDSRRVSIRFFDTIVERMAYGRPSCCQFAADCRNYMVVEWNGDVYPCDFHVTEEWKLGNVLTDDLDKMFNSKKFREFGARKRLWAADCEKCQFLPFCQGDCPKNRDPNTDKSILCEGYKRFFEHALPTLHRLLQDVMAGR